MCEQGGIQMATAATSTIYAGFYLSQVLMNLFHQEYFILCMVITTTIINMSICKMYTNQYQAITITMLRPVLRPGTVVFYTNKWCQTLVTAIRKMVLNGIANLNYCLWLLVLSWYCALHHTCPLQLKLRRGLVTHSLIRAQKEWPRGPSNTRHRCSDWSMLKACPSLDLDTPSTSMQ